MIHPTGLGMLSFLGRSIGNTATAIKVLLLAIAAVGLVFIGEFLFNRPDASVPVFIALIVAYEIWQHGGPGRVFAVIREKIRNWAHRLPIPRQQ